MEVIDKDKALILSLKVSKGDKYFNQESLRKFYDFIDNPRDKAYIIYHAETGLRVSDVVGTEIVHINWQNCSTYTYDFKKDKWRHVFWPEKVKPILKMWLLDRQNNGIQDKRLFPFSTKTAERIVKHWAKELQLPNANKVGTHWLRHTFVRLSRKAGRDIKAVQNNTGDTIKTLLEFYSDLSSEDMYQEINKKDVLN